jgi:DNA-binding MarR family transcriptional regulator
LSDLATNLCLDISTVSRQAKTLEDRGLITRSEDPEDRRAQRIHLAPAGRDILADAWARRHAWLAEALADWSPDDRAELVDVLTRFADSLRADPAPEPPTADQPASDQSASDQPTSYTPTNRETTA